MKMEEKKTSKDKIQCNICPRECILSEGQSGFCRVRKNKNGKIISDVYGYTTGIAIDPAEKKPLYHFYPGTKILSFGTFGCNMGCNFCQNHHISKHSQDFSLSQKASPEEIVQLALKYNCKSIAFTYNDPVVFFEYALDTAKLCRQYGIKTAAVTAGYINPEPRKKFFTLMDAANIDLKGFTDDFYKKNCLAKIQPVLDTIKYAANETNCIVEITTLIIEGENDNPDDLKRQYNWILENLGDEIPLHLSAFHPDYKMQNIPKTSLSTLLSAFSLAKKQGLKYVYTGNIIDTDSSTTICPKCNSKLILRHGYNVRNTGISDGKCLKCGYKIYGCF